MNKPVCISCLCHFRFTLVFLLCFGFRGWAQQQRQRDTIDLNNNWKSVAADQDIHSHDGFELPSYKDSSWKSVTIPHNWDQYEGYRRLLAGNRHGYTWYRKSFKVEYKRRNKRFFLFFEGVGSYATVFLNGKYIGKHAGGRTTFTLDVTEAILLNNQINCLSVRADHPPGIQDLPWVDGGSSTERGFSEGSQPMGIFRPVSLIITNDIKVEPFGIHIWNDNEMPSEIFKFTNSGQKSSASAEYQPTRLHTSTEVSNYGSGTKLLTIHTQLLDHHGKVLQSDKQKIRLKAGGTAELRQQLRAEHPHLWSPADPYLYTVKTQVLVGSSVLDEVNTPYGIRWISWPVGDAQNKQQFLINGKPFFINGIAEYEHLLGNSHAFTAEQIYSRVMQIKSAGFNAFRDAHQPHNLRYLQHWDKEGLLCWTQMAAHIWFDTNAFRENFKTLLREWVKERRNSPSVVLWGLENESTLPEDFARECTAIIREMDPTASSQRKVTTCNGGQGTDWDVPQNWTGTYGGNPLDYGSDLQRQVLIGEYGAWRTLDLHTEGPFVQNGAYSEERICQLMETKIRLAESIKDRTAGHFFWLFNSHDNPGRVQGGEGLRDLDRVGPVNYKGLLSPWEEPLDIYHLYRANYAPKTSPMVYIVSHTWPGRWLQPGIKDSISIYSNCDEVELFNDVSHVSLGRKKNQGRGTHFQWDQVKVNYNVLQAIGYVNGKAVANDIVVLHHLPVAPHFEELYKISDPRLMPVDLQPEGGYSYLYRVNAGGPDYKDSNGNLWMADRPKTSSQNWGSTSWTAEFPGIPAFFASQRRTFDPIQGTQDWKLFQTFRYGRDQLKFEFPVPDGDYLVELYFTEPWYGTGGGVDCSGWRLFDVDINNKIVLKDLDIWKESGHDGALKKSIKVKITGGQLSISFPLVKAGQAIISAIAIASTDHRAKAAVAAEGILGQINKANGDAQNGPIHSWMDIGSEFVSLPSNLFGAQWFRVNPQDQLSFKVNNEADVFIIPENPNTGGDSLFISKRFRDFEQTNTIITNAHGKQYSVFKKRYAKNSSIHIGQVGQWPYPLIVAAQPASYLAPAYDLKSSTTYSAINALNFSQGVTKELFLAKERLKFTQNTGGSVAFQIHVGVADTYSLTLKYHNPLQRSMKGTIEVLAGDGTVMKKASAVEFAPSKSGKWSYFNTDTGTMINAGNYIVKITLQGAVGLYLDALDVQ